MRALPPFRLAEGTDHDAAVPRGGRVHGEPVDTAKWGAARMWATPLLINQWSMQKSGLALTTLTTLGCSAPTITSPGGTVGIDVDSISAVVYTTTTVDGSDSGLVGTHNTRTADLPMVGFSFMPRNDASGCRYWVGLFSGNPMASNTPALHHASFRYSTAVDTRWKCFTDNGGGTPTEPTLINTPHTPVIDVRQNLFIRVLDDGTIQFWGSTGRYRNGDPLTLYAHATTDLPTITTAITYVCQVRKTGGVSAKQIAISRIAGTWS